MCVLLINKKNPKRSQNPQPIRFYKSSARSCLNKTWNSTTAFFSDLLDIVVATPMKIRKRQDKHMTLKSIDLALCMGSEASSLKRRHHHNRNKENSFRGHSRVCNHSSARTTLLGVRCNNSGTEDWQKGKWTDGGKHKFDIRHFA